MAIRTSPQRPRTSLPKPPPTKKPAAPKVTTPRKGPEPKLSSAPKSPAGGAPRPPPRTDLRNLPQSRTPPASVPGSKLSQQQMSDLSSKFKTWGEMNTAVSVARGEMPGRLHPSLASFSMDQLAQLDRFSHFANFGKGISPAVGAVGYPITYGIATGYEYIAKSKLGAPLAKELARRLSPGADRDQFDVNGTTSKPSYDNVRASMHGFWAGIVSGKK